MPTARILILALTLAAALQAATQTFAWMFRFDDALGPALRLGDTGVYWPWSILDWRRRFGGQQPEAFSLPISAFLLVSATGAGSMLLFANGAVRRTRGWGGLAEAARAGLRDGAGCILGRLNGRLLATTDLRPTLVTGGTRAGKGRGHVVPTLLSWTDSVLVHDPKGELWRVTAGWRGRHSHALFFNPRDPATARFNPLAEIRPGPQELAQVQRLVAILSDPGGVRDDEAIWDKAATEILEAVILHVLYTAPDADKTLITVRAMLADLDTAADVMVRTLHRRGSSGEPEVHPFIATAVKGYAAMHDRFRTSVQGTARSYLKWLAGEDLERALSASDFALSDLMCAPNPMSFYVQVAPADAVALRPVVRLLFYAAAQTLTAHETTDAGGRSKRRRLLMLMDEFPLLGRLSFFEKSLRLMSGYGIKTMFVAQSLNDIVETYGPHNTILDNCHVYTAFSALDPLTQDKVSKLTGTILEPKTSRSGPAGLAGGRSSVSRSEVERPLLEPGEVRALPDDVQITFAAGYRPLRTRKVQYDRQRPFRSRADQPVPDQAARIDTPGPAAHPWAGMRSLGEDPSAALPLFKEVEAAIHDKRVAARAAETYERISTAYAAEQAVLDGLQGGSDGRT
ncbi:MAG: type IV secretory system conjugative DNA transfer family protein [Brevundimonas aurantiaca]|jgi:type IV secretion system protein VirD4|uniref:type IV secretory system conjugative DNA transfer family protein n=1 Tax=Brevundimonas TaxID=41275 RepID=UPI0025BB3A9E|nr:type IV secretory system conjugative DNA transfer family protein [Brevundimonas sp.]